MMGNKVRISISYGDLLSEIMADNVSYAPDAVDDMVAQCSRAFSVAIAELRGHGVIRTWDDDLESGEDLIDDLFDGEDAQDE